MKMPIYMDYQATTPMDPRVLEVMLPYFKEKFGNPHSNSHGFGWEAEGAIGVARKDIADVINAEQKEIIFTSGATESNNLALKGLAGFYGDKKKHIITTNIEHKCILDTCRNLQDKGFKVTYLPVNNKGLIDPQQVADAITDETLVVSIMFVNNEIGVIQPIKEIGNICRQKGVFFHTDAAQAFGKLPIDVKDMNIDLMSVSGHKVYGPKGIGALYVGRKPRVRLEALIDGGGQERGMRSGTLPTPLVVGLGEAAKIAQNEMQKDQGHVDKLAHKFIAAMNKIPETYINGDLENRISGNINISFACVEGEAMMQAIKELAVSSGSACTSVSLEPSYVLQALNVSDELAHTSIRFGIGRFTTEEEIDYAIELVNKGVTKLRDLSPLWDMLQDGVDLSTIKWAGHGGHH